MAFGFGILLDSLLLVVGEIVEGRESTLEVMEGCELLHGRVGGFIHFFSLAIGRLDIGVAFGMI